MFSCSQELKDCGKDPETSGLSVKLKNEDELTEWSATIKGPVGTPYEGGEFTVDIKLPSDYPFVPPKVRARPAPRARHATPLSNEPAPSVPMRLADEVHHQGLASKY